MIINHNTEFRLNVFLLVLFLSFHHAPPPLTPTFAHPAISRRVSPFTKGVFPCWDCLLWGQTVHFPKASGHSPEYNRQYINKIQLSWIESLRLRTDLWGKIVQRGTHTQKCLYSTSITQCTHETCKCVCWRRHVANDAFTYWWLIIFYQELIGSLSTCGGMPSGGGFMPLFHSISWCSAHSLVMS